MYRWPEVSARLGIDPAMIADDVAALIADLESAGLIVPFGDGALVDASDRTDHLEDLARMVSAIAVASDRAPDGGRSRCSPGRAAERRSAR